jgi:hypothetical protein
LRKKDIIVQLQVLYEATEDVGPYDVVQVIIDAASVSQAAGLLVQLFLNYFLKTQREAIQPAQKG